MALINRLQFQVLGRVFVPAIFFVFSFASGLSRAQVSASPVEPTEAELQQILDMLESYAVDQMNSTHIPGMAYAIVKGDQIIYAKGFGVRKQGEPEVVDENTLFEIGSNTKAFTATLIAMLVDDGKLNWTDRVEQHLTDFQMKEPWVTHEMQVTDILCNRSGMPGYQLDAMALLGFQRPAIVRAVRWVEPVTSFRSAFAYSNTLYIAAGQLIEEKRGHSWEEDLRERLLQPLGMNSSTGDPDALPTANVATGHIVLSDGSLWPIPEDWRYAYMLKTDGPAGSIYSNVTDMAQWLRFQLANGKIDNKQLISSENLAVTRAPRTLETSDISGALSSYAMGWMYTAASPLPLLWHNGGTSGMHSAVGFVPGADIGIVVLTNAEPVDVPDNVMFVFHFLYFNYQAVTNLAGNTLGRSATQPDLAAFQTSIRKLHFSSAAVLNFDTNVGSDSANDRLSRFAGAYLNPAYGRITVEVQDQSLVTTMGPAKIKFPLVRYRANIFIGALPDYPENEIPVEFKVGPRGSVTGVVVYGLEDVNGGLFEKIW